MKTGSLVRDGFPCVNSPHIMVTILLALALSGSQTVQGAVIGIDDFSGSETLETFDSIDGSMGQVPITTLNGVTYTSLAGGGLKATGGHSSRFDNIPGASLAPAVQDSVPTSDIAIDFSTPVNRVGLLLSAGAVTTWTVAALDDTLTSLGSAEFTMPANNHAVFAGLEFTGNIARLQVTEGTDGNFGSISLFDDLRYEAVIPIPAAVWLFGSGLLGLVVVARRAHP